ncbi:MAG: YeeE/YedE family protein [Gammaproteobacteria bacterium]|nr:MAG: YeeE/YedE family protein [Gammaproteobacteria bacterium]
MSEFEVLKPLIGGMLIGLASAILMLTKGRIAGISGIFEGILMPKSGEISWRLFFISGLIIGGFAMSFVIPERFDLMTNRTIEMIGLGGLMVGFGVHIGCGCTSGHGVCGISRFSPRSFAAVPTFMGTGAVVVYLTNQYIGG